MLLPSVDGIAQFHGKGIFPLLAIFLHCSPDGIAQFYKTYGVWCEKKVSEKLPPQVLFT